MTVAAHRAPYGDDRLRIAITSPDILAQIRRVFAGKNLAVDIVGMPYVEVAVRPAGEQDRKPAVGRDPAGAPTNAPTSRTVLRAEYQLSVIPASEDRPEDTFQLPGADGRETTLSQRQREVMTLMSRGARNAEIAEILHVTEKTVKNHINRIFRELGVDGRVEAVLLWQRLQAQAQAQAQADTGRRWDVEGQ
ncbi:DNA-binding CsgD family transcriptional regulator [Catenulispora sp. GP43]|uniref:helix-turn-helix transcriptional regulator n=1 Tax=Catenulispora sp. GP43 TaxID=3156263 RepID=UPI0035188025